MLGLSLTACSTGKDDDGIILPSPILYDYRQLLAAQDISGLTPGTQAFEFDVYAPSTTGWTEEAETRLTDNIQVLHVNTKASATTRLTLTPLEGRSNARRARLEMDLTAEGSYVVIFGDTPYAIAPTSDELSEQYNVREPETLLPFSDSVWQFPRLMLRTVGACNHLHQLIYDANDDHVLVTLPLGFSEALDPASVPSELLLGIETNQGAPISSVTAQAALVSENALELTIPPMPDTQGVLRIPLGSIPGFAGHFTDMLSCEPADGSAMVGYLPGVQNDIVYVVSPLQDATMRAKGEDQKK